MHCCYNPDPASNHQQQRDDHDVTRMCKEVSSAVHAKPDPVVREGQSDADRHRTDVTVRAEHEAITCHVVRETVLNGSIVLEC